MVARSKSPAPRSRAPLAAAPAAAAGANGANSSGADVFAVVGLVLCVWGLDLQSFLTPATATADTKLGPLEQAKHLGFPLTVFAFMCSVTDRLADDHAARGLNAVHSFALCMATAFGGGMLIPLLTGNSQVYLREETFFWFLLAAWLLTHRTGGAWTALVYRGCPAVKLLGDVLFQVMRCHMITNFCKMGNTAFAHGGPAGLTYFDKTFGNPNARLAGPIVMGALGGSAAAFLANGPSLAPISGAEAIPLFAQAAAAAAMYWIPFKGAELRLPLPNAYTELAKLPAAMHLEESAAQAVAAAFLVCVCVFNGGSVDLRTLPRNFAAKLKKD